MAIAAATDTLSTEILQSLYSLTEAAIKFGPFLFSMLFLLVIVGKAHRMYKEHYQVSQTAHLDYRGFPYMLFLYGSILFSFWLVWYSVDWWRSKQRDLYVFSFEIEGVPIDGKIEVCKLKNVFYKTVPTATNKYTKYTFVILRDEEIVKGYPVLIEYNQPQAPGSQDTVGTGCTLLVNYKGRSGDTFLLPSELPNGPNDPPKILVAKD